MARTKAGAAAPRSPSRDPETGAAVDWGFVSAREGGSRRAAYVPVDAGGRVFGQSGVTVGCGVDLGQHGGPTLSSWGAGPELLEKLRPYIGLRGATAVAAVKAAPLTLTAAEAAVLDAGAQRATLSDVVSRYEGQAQGRRFADLSPGAQTAVVSVAYQYGTRLDIRTPRFWRRALAGDEAAMVAELRSFGDAYGARRNLEADLIAAGLPAKEA
jgi:GH24 family phage-related lysozyme (muramidase)